jgi:DNA-directed RNA polymerase II subunit RPB4
MLVKTTDYLDHFARFKQKENVEAVERLLSAQVNLAKFERAQLGTFSPLYVSRHEDTQEDGYFPCVRRVLIMVKQTGSLCCDTAEEAKTLIPSLQDKISDEDLQTLLDELTKLMGYT